MPIILKVFTKSFTVFLRKDLTEIVIQLIQFDSPAESAQTHGENFKSDLGTWGGIRDPSGVGGVTPGPPSLGQRPLLSNL